MEKDIHKIYTATKGGELTEYLGGSNFSGGNRKCPECGGNMTRGPIGISYVKSGKGFIIVEPRPRDGLLIVTNTEPDYIWNCEGCSCGLRPQKPPTITV